jgi:hypothetical protein
VYQARQHGKWNPRSSAYGRFWIDVRGGERKRRTIALGLCATQWVARLRLREYIERASVHSKHRFHQIPVPGTTFRQQAEWWMESLSSGRRRPLKPATIYGWQHCLDRWILPNLANKLVSEVGNGALRQFVEILTAARLAPKTIVNVVTVVKFVVASAVDEEGDQIHPRVWNYEFMQLPLVIRENQSRPTVTEAEISGLLKSLKERYAVLVALVDRGCESVRPWQFALRIFTRIVRCCTYGEACGTDASKHRRLRTRFDSWISRRHWHKFYADIRKERMATCFTTRAGHLLDQRNSREALHGAGNRGGFHRFRRFRFSVLRRAGVPENLIKQWLAHSQNLMDLYAAQLRLDKAYRREWCDRAGLGFELGELGYKSLAPIRPLLVA